MNTVDSILDMIGDTKVEELTHQSLRHSNASRWGINFPTNPAPTISQAITNEPEIVRLRGVIDARNEQAHRAAGALNTAFSAVDTANHNLARAITAAERAVEQRTRVERGVRNVVNEVRAPGTRRRAVRGTMDGGR